MPEGYYSGDKTNPYLREFMEKNITACDPEHDDYQVEPFNEAITTTKARAIYNMHTYWSRKPHDAILHKISPIKLSMPRKTYFSLPGPTP